MKKLQRVLGQEDLMHLMPVMMRRIKKEYGDGWMDLKQVKLILAKKEVSHQI